MQQNFCTVCHIPIAMHVQQCAKHRKGAKDSAKSQRNQSKVASTYVEEEDKGGKPDHWADLHDNKLCTGIIQLQSLADAHQVNGHGLPDLIVLQDMYTCCNKMKLGAAVGKYNEPLGICFHICNYTAPVGQGKSNCSLMTNRHVTNKPSSGVCYENTFLPLAVAGGHVLVRQNLAPCMLCCQGYKMWAQRDGCTIIVSYDKGYDGSGSGGVYIFSSTGLVFQI